MTAETRAFQAEVSRLLDIVAHALYSDRDVFLRELISNAADACDRHRYLRLTDPDLAASDDEPTASYAIRLSADPAAQTLTIADNGIGMTRDDLIDLLGTIARSGTAGFLDRLSGDAKKDVSLIGQFGVGFYSAFMVADRVEVVSRKAGEAQTWRWSSDGRGSFMVEEAANAPRGTAITLHLKADALEFTEADRLRRIVKRHSDHIAVPVILAATPANGTDGADETLNAASALWTRPRSEITEEQLDGFFHSLSFESGKPFATVHTRAEGAIEYSALLFLPRTRPFDLFHPDRQHKVKLYVRRVFITDACQGLMPSWLRFVVGVVDSADLPLNVSREMLQNNPVVPKIRSGLVKKVLAELEKRAGDADYLEFWQAFGPVLKEGLYEDFDHRDALLKLARFRTTHASGWTSLADYIARMKPGQEAIFTISGEDEAASLASPHLEGFTAKGVEVLLLTDPIDEFWMPSVGAFDGKPFRSITRGAAEDLSKIEGDSDTAATAETAPAASSDAMARLTAAMAAVLGDAVKSVAESKRLTDSAVCLVAADGDMDMRLEKLLRQHKQLDQARSRVLELNPRHPVVRRLAALVGTEGDKALLADAAWLLLDQARILDGQPVPDPRAFARRLDAVMAAGLPNGLAD